MYTNELNFITEKIKEAYNRFAAAGPNDVRSKSAFDLVTEVDVNVETFLTQAIEEAFPGDRIHAEELSSSQTIEGRTWVIDPIDGTCNFAHNIPIYGIQPCDLCRSESSQPCGTAQLRAHEEGIGCHARGIRLCDP